MLRWGCRCDRECSEQRQHQACATGAYLPTPRVAEREWLCLLAHLAWHLASQSLPVAFGIDKAKWICVASIDLTQLAVALYLLAIGETLYAQILAGLVVPQMVSQITFLQDPVANDVKYQVTTCLQHCCCTIFRHTCVLQIQLRHALERGCFDFAGGCPTILGAGHFDHCPCCWSSHLLEVQVHDGSINRKRKASLSVASPLTPPCR